MPTATLETPRKLNAHFIFTGIKSTDPRLDGLDSETLDRLLTEGATIEKFKKSEIGFSEVAELLGFSNSAEAMEWLNSKGVETLRGLPADLDSQAQDNLNKARQIIGIGK